MKIGMNVGWDIADGWRFLVLGSRAQHAQLRAKRARMHLFAVYDS